MARPATGSACMSALYYVLYTVVTVAILLGTYMIITGYGYRFDVGG